MMDKSVWAKRKEKEKGSKELGCMGNIQITDRDLKLIKMINHYGFLDIAVLMRQFNMGEKVAYRRLYRLVRKGFLTHDKLFFKSPGVYRATQAGVMLANDRLPPLKNINLATYQHDLLVAKLSMVLEQREGGVFTPERLLRHQRGLNRVGQRTHVPDGELIVGDKKIAIEVELSTKGRSRLEKIIKHYSADFSTDAVWYFYDSNEVKNKLNSVMGDRDFVKLFDLTDYMSEQLDYCVAG